MNDRLDAQELKDGARVLHALAHPLRLAIMQELQGGEQNVTALYERLGCSQSMMSQQLRLLEDQGLIKSRKEGTCKHCSIHNEDFLQLFHCLKNHLNQVLARP